jgi:hypothetical protein
MLTQENERLPCKTDNELVLYGHDAFYAACKRALVQGLPSDTRVLLDPTTNTPLAIGTTQCAAQKCLFLTYHMFAPCETTLYKMALQCRETKWERTPPSDAYYGTRETRQ